MKLTHATHITGAPHHLKRWTCNQSTKGPTNVFVGRYYRSFSQRMFNQRAFATSEIKVLTRTLHSTSQCTFTSPPGNERRDCGQVKSCPSVFVLGFSQAARASYRTRYSWDLHLRRSESINEDVHSRRGRACPRKTWMAAATYLSSAIIADIPNRHLVNPARSPWLSVLLKMSQGLRAKRGTDTCLGPSQNSNRR